MIRSFSRKLPPRTSSKRWQQSEAGRFNAAYTAARETLGINDSIKAAAAALGVSEERARELWHNFD